MKPRGRIDWVLIGCLMLVAGSGAVSIMAVMVLGVGGGTGDIVLNSTYTIAQPDWTRSLPGELEEISGVAVDPEGTVAYAINDEQGSLFMISLVNGAVTSTSKFAKNGDYEAVEKIGNAIVVARSDGKLYWYEDGQVRKYDSPLKYANDIEGLAYDKRGKRLLVACKRRPGKNKGDYENKKAVWAVSLPDMEWSSKPVYKVDLLELRSYVREHLVRGLVPAQADDFAPSGIAVEPSTGDLYIVSTTGRMIVVLHRDNGRIISVAPLIRSLHGQPEGLAFDANGSMYISNEGRGGRGVLHRFDRRNGPGGTAR